MLVRNQTRAGITAADYFPKESAGVSALVGVSSFSLVAVLGLFFLMGVSILFSVSVRVAVGPYLHPRFLRGPIGAARTGTSSFELMSPPISSVSWPPILSKVRVFYRLYAVLRLTATPVAIGSIMNARWVQMGGVHSGQFCAAQGMNT